MRSSASHPAGPHDRLAQTNGKSGPHCGGQVVPTQFAQQFVSAVTVPPLVCCVVWSQLIVHVIRNSDHKTPNTDTPTRVPNNTLQQTSSPDITTMSNTLYNRTSWITQHAISSDHLPINTTINIRHDYRLQQNRRTFINYKKADSTQFTEDTESAFAQTTIHTSNIFFYKHHSDCRQAQHTKGKIHSNCRLIVCKITQRNTIRRANTCDPALKLLNEKITSHINKT